MLKKGFLPENLPPAFTSTNLWQHYEGQAGSYLIKNGTVGSLASYNASKRGNQRRLFGLPHPTFFVDMALFFEKHWTSLNEIMQADKGSLSTPFFAPTSPRAIRITPHSELPKERLKALSRFRFCLVTDVSRFYPSIYTHSVPWAINGRANAKADRNAASATVYGNRLDFILRQAQDGQTIGIPVGPDTSRITSELILCAVDNAFISKAGKKVRYLRHVDDYWIGGNTIVECEGYLRDLRSSLRGYELDINELKTKIVPTNQVFGDSWPMEFERDLIESFSAWHPRAGSDQVSTLSKIVDRSTRENDDGMIKHAIRKIDQHELWNGNWEVLEHFLAQSSVQFTHAFDYVARVIAWRCRTGRSYDQALWVDVAKLVAAQSAELGRDSEALWALWLLKELRTKIPKRLSDSMIRNNGALTLGYLAHMYVNGLTSDKNIPARLWATVEARPFSGSSWPLTLELTHLGLAAPAGIAAPEKNEITALHDIEASLIDWNAAPKVFSDDDHEVENPTNAIEDYTSDYDDDVEDFFDDIDDDEDLF